MRMTFLTHTYKPQQKSLLSKNKVAHDEIWNYIFIPAFGIVIFSEKRIFPNQINNDTGNV